MVELAGPVLSYALWPVLILALLGLWLAAAVEIARHRRGGAFTDAKLLGMGAAVSVVAVIALAAAGATVGGAWAEAVTAGPGEARAETQARSYIFSFGLEHASFSAPAEPTPEKQPRHN